MKRWEQLNSLLHTDDSLTEQALGIFFTLMNERTPQICKEVLFKTICDWLSEEVDYE